MKGGDVGGVIGRAVRSGGVWLVSVLLLGCSLDVSRPITGSSGGFTVDPGPPPTACRLDTVAVPADAPPLLRACLRLLHAARVRVRVCGAAADPPGEAFVESCLALAKAPGSLLASEELDACAASLCGLHCDDPPGCLMLQPFELGREMTLLSPGRERRGSLADGTSCVANHQCRSGLCSCGHGEPCGFPYPCTGTCVAGIGPHDRCELTGAYTCDVGKCELSSCIEGKPDGEPCTWFYGTEGCAHRCRMDHCAPFGKVGEWCGGASNSNECDTGLVCLQNRCAAPLPDRQPCGVGVECQHACIDGTCASPSYGKGPGEPCHTFYVRRGPRTECLPELRCVDGRCAAPPPVDGGVPPSPDTRSGEGGPCPCALGYGCNRHGVCAPWGPALCDP